MRQQLQTTGLKGPHQDAGGRLAPVHQRDGHQHQHIVQGAPQQLAPAGTGGSAEELHAMRSRQCQCLPRCQQRWPAEAFVVRQRQPRGMCAAARAHRSPSRLTARTVFSLWMTPKPMSMSLHKRFVQPSSLLPNTQHEDLWRWVSNC